MKLNSLQDLFLAAQALQHYEVARHVRWDQAGNEERNEVNLTAALQMGIANEEVDGAIINAERATTQGARG